MKWVEASNAEIQSTKREQAIQGIASLHRGVTVIRRRESGGDRSGERQGHQARAEQDQAAGSQCQEAIGNQVVVTHGTPAALVFDARSDRSKLSERAVVKEVMLAVCASAFRPSCGSLQTHGPGRSPRLPDPSVPKPSRSSLNSKSRPCTRENACGLAQSKEFRWGARQWGWSEDSAQQNVQPWHTADAIAP